MNLFVKTYKVQYDFHISDKCELKLNSQHIFSVDP